MFGGMMVSLAIELIRTDGGTQTRTELNETVVDEYAEAIHNGARFPAVEVFYDGQAYWLADGFHRLRAFSQIGCLDIQAKVHQGTRRDAVLFSVGANDTNGLRRTNADKRRAVETLLNDEEWALWSDAEIARRCAVSPMTVGRIRPEIISNKVIDTNPSPPAERTVTRNGTTYTQKTQNIGKKSGKPKRRQPSPPSFPQPVRDLPRAELSPHGRELLFRVRSGVLTELKSQFPSLALPDLGAFGDLIEERILDILRSFEIRPLGVHSHEESRHVSDIGD